MQYSRMLKFLVPQLVRITEALHYYQPERQNPSHKVASEKHGPDDEISISSCLDRF